MSEENIIKTLDATKPNFKIDEIVNALKYRYATKKFDPNKKISKEHLDLLLEAARLAPTSMGFEPWKMIVLEDQEVRQALKPFAWGAQNALDNASQYIVFIANKKPDLIFGSQHIDHMLKDIHKVPDNVYEFFKKAYTDFSTKHFNTLESDRAAFDWAAKQAYIVMSNIMLTAALIGIDSCAIEGFQPREFDRILGSELKLYDLEHYSACVTLALGYRNELPHRDKTRRTLSESVIWK